MPAALAAGAVSVGAAGCGPSEGPRVAAADPPATTAERAASEPAAKPDRGGHGPRRLPSAAGLHSAKGYAADREGVVSIATVNSDGRLRGYRENRRYASASVVKAMLLAAEMRRLKHAGQAVDSSTDSVLTAMITISDNGAADTIYNRVGDAGLNAVAERAGMTRFTVAGYWGNAQIAAADMARFFGDLDRQFPRRFREYAKGLLGSVTESQSWGIPAVAGKRWAVCPITRSSTRRRNCASARARASSRSSCSPTRNRRSLTGSRRCAAWPSGFSAGTATLRPLDRDRNRTTAGHLLRFASGGGRVSRGTGLQPPFVDAVGNELPAQ